MPMEELYLDIINSLHEGIYFADLDRRILFWNKAAEDITGYSAEEIVGKPCPETNLNHIDEDGRPLCEIGCPLFATNIDGKPRRARVFVRHREGYRVPIVVNVTPVQKDGRIIGSIENFTQNSPTVYEDALVERLSGIAMHDALTGLPNRRYLESFLSFKLEEYARFNKPLAVLFADIDDFRLFNNNYGHEFGDTVLKSIAKSLKKSVRRDDLLGRWGGEELLGVYSLNQPFDAPILAEKFRLLVEHTEIPHEGSPLRVTVSVGITVAQPGDTAESIVSRADRLMYRSKKEGKNRISTD